MTDQQMFWIMYVAGMLAIVIAHWVPLVATLTLFLIGTAVWFIRFAGGTHRG
jgi:CHASE2 domain-containing sensor protein